VRAALLVAAGLALLPAPAVARELPSTTPDPGVAAFDRDVSLIATNGSRTFVSGLFATWARAGATAPSSRRAPGRCERSCPGSGG
jgi:hypothetical protein